MKRKIDPHEAAGCLAGLGPNEPRIWQTEDDRWWLLTKDMSPEATELAQVAFLPSRTEPLFVLKSTETDWWYTECNGAVCAFEDRGALYQALPAEIVETVVRWLDLRSGKSSKPASDPDQLTQACYDLADGWLRRAEELAARNSRESLFVSRCALELLTLLKKHRKD